VKEPKTDKMTVTDNAPQVEAPVAVEKVEEVDNIVPGPPAAESVGKLHEKKLKALLKEGGKKGVEVEGASDMGGLQFFCTTVDMPEGNLDYLVESMKAMNAKSDPSEEERKGGAGKIGKMLYSISEETMACVAYVPLNHAENCSATEWLQSVIDLAGAGKPEIVNWEGVSASSWAGCVMKKDGNAGVFPIKLRDPAITNAYTFLKKKGLFPDGDDDDEDDFVFGDDDFP